MKAVWLTATIALVAIAYSLNAAAQLSARGPTTLAFVSGRRLLAASPDMRAALQRFQATRLKEVAELQGKQRALQETRRKLAQAPTAAARTELLKQEQAQKLELERLTAQAQADIQASQQEAQAMLQSQLKPVLDEIVKAQGIEVVLNSDVAMMWGSPQLDITQAVIEKLNAAKTPPLPKK